MKNYFRADKNSEEGSPGGLAIYDDALYCAWPGCDRHETIRLEEGYVSGGSIKDFSALERAFKRLGELVDFPVVIGLPLLDVIIKQIPFPEMDMSDIKSTLDLSFEEYFPYSRAEAAIDIAKITIPASSMSYTAKGTSDFNWKDQREREINILAASAKRKYIEGLLRAVKAAGIRVASIEPVGIAILRSVRRIEPNTEDGLCLTVNVHAGLTNIAATWGNNEILFRTAYHGDNKAASVQDIQSTIQFIETQYRGFSVRKIILVDDSIGKNISSQLEFSFNNRSETFTLLDNNVGILASDGLAMREEQGSYLDLRPLDYLALEKRRNSFNFTRIVGIALLCAFIIMSIWTVVSTLHSISVQKSELKIQRTAMNNLLKQRSELEKRNISLRKQEAKVKKVLSFIHDDILALEVLNALETNTGAGVEFLEISFVRNEAGCIVTLKALANDESSIITMTRNLNDSGLFRSVVMPGADKNENGRISFSLILHTEELNKIIKQ